MTFLMMLSVILVSMLIDDTTLYSKASDLWQQLESDLQDTVDWVRKWLVDFNAGKTQLVSFEQSNNTGAIDVKMDWSVLELLSPEDALYLYKFTICPCMEYCCHV